MENLKQFKTILGQVEDVYLRLPIDQITPEHNLVADLGLDSLGRITLYYELSQEMGIEPNEQQAFSWNTVSDILSFLEQTK